MEKQLKDEEKSEGGGGSRGGEVLHGERVRIGSHRQPEVLLMFAVNSQSKVLVAGLRQSVLFVQNVQDSHQLGFHQVWRKSDGVKIPPPSSQFCMMSDAQEIIA